jgi:hypothetical protein
MMLVMLASLSSYCQYPTTKKIGKDTVVIMTISQAENINSQFTKFKDSILSINRKNTVLSEKVDTVSFQKQYVLDSLTKVYDSMLNSQKKMQIAIKDRDDAYIYAKKIKKDFQANTLLAFIGLGVFTIIVTLMK